MINNCKEKLDDDFIFITTDKEHYDAGNTILITGCVSDLQSLKDLSLQIVDPENKIIKVSTLIPESDGSFDTEYIIDDEFGLDGKYSATVEFGDYSSTKTFTVPEFGSIAMVILLISVVSIILLALKSGVIHDSFIPQYEK
jgi:predicted secreted protein with PEFG-CTERM motif